MSVTRSLSRIFSFSATTALRTYGTKEYFEYTLCHTGSVQPGQRGFDPANLHKAIKLSAAVVNFWLQFLAITVHDRCEDASHDASRHDEDWECGGRGTRRRIPSAQPRTLQVWWLACFYEGRVWHSSRFNIVVVSTFSGSHTGGATTSPTGNNLEGGKCYHRRNHGTYFKHCLHLGFSYGTLLRILVDTREHSLL